MTISRISRREGENTRAEAFQVLRLAGKGDAPVGKIAVIERPDPDGIPGSDQPSALPIKQDQSKLRVQLLKHAEPVFLIQRQQQLAVRVAAEDVALCLQLAAHGTPAIELAVAHELAFAQRERLHALVVQAHDGETMKAEQPRSDRLDPGIVRPA